MTDSLIRAWALAAADDFGGSLDEPPPAPIRKPHTGAVPTSGVAYCYRIPGGWQVRIPGVKTRKFDADALDTARAFVRLHVEGV